MAFTNSDGVEINVVHGPGVTVLKHAPRESGLDILFTGGDDYLVRALPSLHDGEFQAVTMDEATAEISSIDCNKDYLVTASLDACVRVYLLDKPHDPHALQSRNVGDAGIEPEPWSMEILLTRTSLPVRCAAIEKILPTFSSPEEYADNPAAYAPRVAVCSEELVVKLINIVDPLETHLLTGHTRPVRHAAWSPTDAALITCSCDGTARVWDLSMASGDVVCTQVIKDILAVTRQTDTSRASMACWHPSGKLFLLPSKTNEIIIMGRNHSGEWERKGVFNGRSETIDPPSGAITAMEFSPNGLYLATATTSNGQVTIWDVRTKTPIQRRVAEADVTSISWHPSRNALAWTDLQGQIYRWENAIHASRPAPYTESATGAAAATSAAPNKNAAAAPAAQRAGSVAAPGRRDQFDEDDEFAGEFDDADLDMLDDQAHAGGHGAGYDEDEDEDGDDDGGDIDGFVVDDDEGAYARELQRERIARKRRAMALQRKRQGHLVSSTPAQPAFQPTATPMKNQRRYLAFNMIGTLVAVDQDNHQTIMFDSYDTSARRNYRIQDVHKFSMAALGYHGALFACEKRGEANSSLFFKPFDSIWGGTSGEWAFDLPRGESAICVALGGPPTKPDDEESVGDAASTVALVATSTGYVRIFSASGLQRFIWHLGGQVVTMVAGSHTAMIVTRGPGAALGGFQNLNFTLLDLQTLATINQGSLPLSKGTELKWLGFNEYDTPAVFDSNGVLSLLDGARCGYSAKWVPVLDTRTIPGAASGAEIRYWPINTVASKLLVLMLKGAQTSYPDASAARPLVQELDFAMPLLESHGSGPAAAVHQHEEAWLRQSLVASMIRGRPSAISSSALREDPDAIETSADKALLQLIQLSCKSDKHKRAIDAARELHSSRTLEAALKIAQYFQLPSLADRMEQLREFVETRRGRIEEVGHIFASGVSVTAGPPSSHPHAKVLVPASQDSREATREAARRALTEDFAPRASASLRGPSGTLSSSVGSRSTPFVNPVAPPKRISIEEQIALEEQREEEEEEARRRLLRRAASAAAGESAGTDSMDSNMDSPGKENLHPEESELRSANLKRKLADELMPPPAADKRIMTKSGSSNPFVRKPAGNPFAKTPGNMTRDRSLHKSNSFFDRVDAASGTVNGSAISKSETAGLKKKQSKLFGFTKGPGGTSGALASLKSTLKASNDAQKEARSASEESQDSALDVGTGDNETQEEEPSAESLAERAFEEEMKAEESLRATLEAARRMEAESQQLEETQYADAGPLPPGTNRGAVFGGETMDESQFPEDTVIKSGVPIPSKPEESMQIEDEEQEDEEEQHAEEEESARSKLEQFRAPAPPTASAV